MTTPQEQFWKSDFGTDYTKRNWYFPDDLDAFYVKQFGVARSEMNRRFLVDLKISNVLEVGANMGAQLLMLQKMGYRNLYGIEINVDAIDSAQKNTKGLNIVEGSAFDIPFKDSYFDMVFTSGVLIHISPDTLEGALREIYRTTKKYIWGFEYFAETYTTINYRGNDDRLWKGNFSKLYLDMFPDLKLVKEERFKYVADNNCDTMFLLEKI
jgi:pseudaminic acid biosynthesis-associated methylase